MQSFASSISKIFWKSLIKMVKPAQTEVQACNILVFSSRSNRFIYCCDGFIQASKICLENRHVEQRILVVGPIPALHGIIKVTMKIIERRSIVTSTPRIKEPGIRSARHHRSVSGKSNYLTKCKTLGTELEGPTISRKRSFMSGDILSPSPTPLY